MHFLSAPIKDRAQCYDLLHSKEIAQICKKKILFFIKDIYDEILTTVMKHEVVIMLNRFFFSFDP